MDTIFKMVFIDQCRWVLTHVKTKKTPIIRFTGIFLIFKTRTIPILSIQNRPDRNGMLKKLGYISTSLDEQTTNFLRGL